MRADYDRSKRILFLGSLVSAMVAVIALTAWLLLRPFWFVYRAGQRPIPWQDYSSDRLAQLLSERRNILLVGWADWDISSAYPPHATDTPRVRRAIESRQIVPLLVNMSNPSAETDALREFLKIPENTFPLAAIISGDAPDQPVTILEWSGPNDEAVFNTIEAIPPRKPGWE